MKKLVVFFTGLADRVGGVDKEDIRANFSHHDTEFIFLKDSRKLLYLAGSDDFQDFNELVQYLASLKNAQLYESIKFIGTSAGGFGAYLYGTLLDVECISFSGFYALDLNTMLLNDAYFYSILPSRARYEHLKRIHSSKEVKKKYLNLRQLRRRSDGTKTAICFYPNRSPQDVIRGNYMLKAPRTIVIPVSGNQHIQDFKAITKDICLTNKIFHVSNDELKKDQSLYGI